MLSIAADKKFQSQVDTNTSNVTKLRTHGHEPRAVGVGVVLHGHVATSLVDTMSSNGEKPFKAAKGGSSPAVTRGRRATVGPTDGKRLYDAAKEGHVGAVRMWLSKGVPWDAWKTDVSLMHLCFLCVIAWPTPLMHPIAC